MTAPPWQAFADRFLAREALRFRFDRGEPPRDFAGIVIADAELDHLIREVPGLRSPLGGLDEASLADLDAQVEAARTALAGWLEEPDDLLGAVAWTLQLDVADFEVLSVVAATEIDTARQTLVAYLNDNVALKRPSLGLLARLFPPPHPGPAAVGPDAVLRRAAIVGVESEGPWAAATVRLARSVAWMIAGDRSLDELLPLGARLEFLDVDGDGSLLVLVTGGDVMARRSLAFDATVGNAFLVVSLPENTHEWEAVVRQATVAGLGVVVELGAGQRLDGIGARTIERAPHLAWAISSPRDLPVESLPQREHADLAVDPDAHRVRRGSHVLDLEQNRLVSLTAAGRAEDWDGAVRRLAGGHLDELAIRIRPHRTWDDLVLAPEQMTQARELVARYRHRSTVYGQWGFPAVVSSGLTALFAGPSGTGKTMTAEVVAADLGLDLYRIDLSSVVSKYIGETEKNLERIFTAATAGNVVLFFDEADALFGKRSEVGDAHDRYANIEVSYLLQRLEQYDGVVILATNLKKNLDDAFLRRIDVAIEFILPEREQRRAIWEKAFGEGAPRGELDFDFLAERFDISGGTITDAALASAFLAAERGDRIQMEDVVLGLKREFQKLGRLRTESEFDRYLDLVTGDAHVAPAG